MPASETVLEPLYVVDWQDDPSQLSAVTGAWVSGPLMTWETVSTDVRTGAPPGWPAFCNQSRKALSVLSSTGPQSLRQLL